ECYCCLYYTGAWVF
nr:immunoglobulin light chain junction region [Macaca mulatta]